MFTRRLSEVRVTLQIIPAAPLLIKEGRHLEGEEHDRERRSFHRVARRTPPRPRRREGVGYGDYDSSEDCFDMAFVWTQTARGGRFYLPGSSLRGLLRGTAEQVVARWRPDWACASDPFVATAQEWIKQQRDAELHLDGAAIYNVSGPLDRCFGHTALRGRWTLADALMVDEQQAGVVVRDGVGIDRQTGSARSGIKFQFEAITGGVFETTLTLLNYELWQLGLLAHALAAIDGGVVRLGYGRQRGLGRVRIAIPRMTFRWYGAQPRQENTLVVLPSLYQLARDAGLGEYTINDQGQNLALPLEALPGVIGSDWELVLTPGAPEWDAAPWPQFAGLLGPALENWPPPPLLKTLEEDRQ